MGKLTGITERENLICVLKGERPAWVPSLMNAVQSFSPEIMHDPSMDYDLFQESEGERLPWARDVFGAKWVLDKFGAIAAPGSYLMNEISEWEERVHFPDLDGYDWDGACARDRAKLEEGKFTCLMICFFMNMVNALGYEEALLSLALDEEESVRYLDRLCHFFETMIRKVVPRMECDGIIIADDIANSLNLFMSPETYRRVLKPFHKRLIDAAKEVKPDIYVEFHCCGHCEDVIGDFVELGADMWEPCQSMNDVQGIRQKYGSRLTLCGVWDNVKIVTENWSEERVRRSVRDVMDTYAENGGYMFWDGSPIAVTKEENDIYTWANDEAVNYGRTLYL